MWETATCWAAPLNHPPLRVLQLRGGEGEKGEREGGGGEDPGAAKEGDVAPTPRPWRPPAAPPGESGFDHGTDGEGGGGWRTQASI